MYEPKMQLTEEQRQILNGKEGDVKAKVMETIVRYGDMFEADRLVPVTTARATLSHPSAFPC